MNISEPGQKFDCKKPRTDLLPPDALLEVAAVLGFGATKYSEDNWKKVPNLERRYIGAALRHILAIMSGEDLDPETSLHHEAHAICCLLFTLQDKIENEKRRKEERLRKLNESEHQKSNRTIEWQGDEGHY